MNKNFRIRYAIAKVCLAASTSLLLSATAVAGTDAPAADASSPFLGGFIKGSSIQYPLAIGHWKAADEHRYDSQEAGVSVRYADDRSGRWIDVYFYPVGALSDKDVDAEAITERQGLIDAHLQNSEAKDAIGDLRPYDITWGSGDDANKRHAYSLDLAYDVKGAPRSSAMVVVFDRLYMVKTRYDIPEDGKRTQARKELEDFTEALVPKLEISSYGTCWSPLPIEQLEAGKPVPEGSSMSMQTDGVTTEYVFADRVLAKDPTSTGAKAAALIGMALQDRMYDGCEGNEPAEPVVAEGMREIRFEYRPPTAVTTP
jgi:hypothetical protein